MARWKWRNSATGEQDSSIPVIQPSVLYISNSPQRGDLNYVMAGTAAVTRHDLSLVDKQLHTEGRHYPDLIAPIMSNSNSNSKLVDIEPGGESRQYAP